MNTCKDIAARVESLPPLPDTAMKLLNVVNDPHSSVEDMVEAIRYDQAVTTELLRICNSAFCGLSRRISSLNDATAYLGTVKVMQLVMAVHTDALLRGEQKGYGLDAGELWKHSVGVALAATAVAERLNVPNTSQFFTAGLLHDVGKVVLSQYVGEEFSEIVRRVTEEHQSFSEAEQEVLGFSHQQIGGEIADLWKLPESIALCIRYHHDPGALDPPNPVVDAVHVADCVAMMCGIGVGADGLAYRIDPAVVERCKLQEKDLEAVGAEMLMELKRVEGIFARPDGEEAADT